MTGRYKTVFVVLTYRNTTDLVDFLESLRGRVADYRVVVADSFYDEATRDAIRELAERNDCDFLSVENRGYGAGNNRGIEFACAHYEFERLVVANPDTTVETFSEQVFERIGSLAIIGPKIIRADGRDQNPMRTVYSPAVMKAQYRGYSKHRRLPVWFGIGWNKFLRGVRRGKRLGKGLRKVYELHGSFVIFTRKALTALGLPYDEKMFLFAEEDLVAFRASKLGIPMVYASELVVRHKEDGSMKFSKENLDGRMSESFRYFYETYQGKAVTK